MKLTANETKVYNAVLTVCEVDYCADMDDIITETNLPVATIRGLLGTLTQKGLIHTETDIRAGKKFDDIFACTENGDVISYGELT